MNIKPIDVKSYSYAELNEDSNVTKPKFNVGVHVRISKYKNLFAKGYTKNSLENLGTCVISNLDGEPITGHFY